MFLKSLENKSCGFYKKTLYPGEMRTQTFCSIADAMRHLFEAPPTLRHILSNSITLAQSSQWAQNGHRISLNNIRPGFESRWDIKKQFFDQFFEVN
jgi:hypothetical protein